MKKGTTDNTFREYAVMKAMRWSWDELMNVPEEIYQSIIRIMGVEGRERSKEDGRTGMDARNKGRR